MSNTGFSIFISLLVAAGVLTGCSLMQPLTRELTSTNDTRDESGTSAPERSLLYPDTTELLEACIFAPDDYLYYCRLLEQTLIQRDTIDLDLIYGDMERQYGEIQRFTNVADSALLELKRQYTRELTAMAGV
nr:hypothetical protein [bacterium]